MGLKLGRALRANLINNWQGVKQHSLTQSCLTNTELNSEKDMRALRQSRCVEATIDNLGVGIV